MSANTTFLPRHQLLHWTSQTPTRAATTYFSEHEPEQRNVTRDNHTTQEESLLADHAYQSQRNSQTDSQTRSQSATTMCTLPLSTLLKPPRSLSPVAGEDSIGPKQNRNHHTGTRSLGLDLSPPSSLLSCKMKVSLNPLVFLSPSSISLSWILLISI